MLRVLQLLSGRDPARSDPMTLSTMTWKWKWVTRVGYTYPHILLAIHWPSTNKLVKWTGSQGKSSSIVEVWWRAEKQDKTGMPEEQTTAYHCLPIWGTRQPYDFSGYLGDIDQERQYMCQRIENKSHFTHLFMTSLTYEIFSEWLLYAGCCLVLEMQRGVKIDTVHDPEPTVHSTLPSLVTILPKSWNAALTTFLLCPSPLVLTFPSLISLYYSLCLWT